MTDTHSLRPDARLVHLHAERGDPQARLAGALADLEGADWGLLFSGEAALARQLVALLGSGTLRVDGRVNLSRAAFAEAGLAVADLHGDLHGARAAWLLEPDDYTLERARRAGVPIIVDATLAPGGGWTAQGADFVVYRDGATLSGQGDVALAALFGMGTPPAAQAAAPGDLSVALALRDVATLPLRLARAARTVSNVAERLGGSARTAGPTALLLPHETMRDTLTPLGGVLLAARHVPEGLLLTPGLEDTEAVVARVQKGQEGERPQHAPAQRPAVANPPVPAPSIPGSAPAEGQPPQERPRHVIPLQEPARSEDRERRNTRDSRDTRDGRDGNRRFERRPRNGDRPDRPQPDRPRPERPQPGPLERFTFEAAPAQINHAQVAEQAALRFPVPPAPPAPSPISNSTEETWEPEIVFSDLESPPPLLTHTVSNGPDPADQRAGLPDVLHLDMPNAAPVVDDVEDAGDAAAVVQPSAELLEAARMVEEHAPNPAPDLPGRPETVADAPAKEDPAANLTDEQAAIYARLREWRNAEAKRQEISRFIIASNASLAEIARRVPYTLEDLAAVRGMGKARLEKYGEKILAVVRN